MGGRKRYIGLIDRVAWVGLALVPMHRQLMEAQLKCFPFHDEYLAIGKALEGVRACASGLVGDETPFRLATPPMHTGESLGARNDSSVSTAALAAGQRITPVTLKSPFMTLCSGRRSEDGGLPVIYSKADGRTA
jgi:hypothetical protein